MKEQAAAFPALDSKLLVQQAKQNLNDAALISLPRDPSLQKTVQRARATDDGPQVNKRDASEILLLEEQKVTKHGQRFLLLDSRDREPESPVYFAYASDYGIKLLRDNDRWAIDGTFYCTPPSFKQMFSINVFKGESSLPAAFFLLPDKSAETYQRAMNAFFDNPLLVGVAPSAVMAGKLICSMLSNI